MKFKIELTGECFETAAEFKAALDKTRMLDAGWTVHQPVLFRAATPGPPVRATIATCEDLTNFLIRIIDEHCYKGDSTAPVPDRSEPLLVGNRVVRFP